ncbi:T-complex protein 11-like protein 2 [Mustela nigripes]|uniref:T-complex protein 11-like protein 2 n=1 Tax=Neovison vison TaxID=452646 RepID=UPI001CEFD6EF|nr:T-complex protein 11-like protein 2 [Neogale vison]XP_044083095.1 T-complex protein 11-like protein 2 [Neogale vison]XP_044083096.1 T-complex protein 11-like protein 2 [Neogale vison]XP_059258167.1 T-complex protein 11-like protein 2 [Mustela nigripes]XP_059258168.1 T-complex protein 11-like protein 2 [Mustela nigripes]XP_059258170.1 T-complex protein 11-like protein 2 [Mustela nigripes]
MPFNGEKQHVGEDQPRDSDSSRFSESMASLSDYECSRQSFTSDSSSKSSSPASTSPPRVVTFDKVMAAARNLSNMTLVHEIAVNESFQLKQDALPENSLASQVKHIVHQAFWDVLESELNAEPPEYEHAIKLFEEIRETLLSFLTPGGNRLRNQICEVLDTDLIRQQAEHRAVDIQGLANYVISTMGKLCAPVRDDDVRELKATSNIVEVLRQIFHVLDLMKIDMVNFTIRSLRPHLQRQLVDYERTKFQEILEETPSALDQTTEWLKESVNEELLSLSETALTPGAENSSKPSLSPTLVLNNSYLKLLHWDYQKKELPETLITDGARLQELTEKLNQLKIIACLSLITNNMVGALTEGLPELANRLKRISAVLLEGMNKETTNLKEILNSIGAQTCVEINKALAERGLSILNAEVQANLIGQFSSIEKEGNPIWSLIDKRTQLYMKSLLCLPSPQKCMPPVPGGLAVIQQELEALGSQYANIVNLNRQVYGPFYANILRKLLFGEEAMGKADASSSN